jgi:hypothetical protein
MLTWDEFVAGLFEYAHPSDGDRVLWRVTKPDREMVCREREIARERLCRPRVPH